MGRVFVAGSINMDVVATADRHPRIGETVAGDWLLYFPGGKGANQAVAAAKLGAATTLIGRLGKDAFGRDLRTFLAAQGIDLASCRTRRRPYRHGDHHRRQCRKHHRRHSRRQCPGERGRCRGGDACERRRRGQPVRDSAARDRGVLPTRARGRRDDDPQSGSGIACDPRCSNSSISSSSMKANSVCWRTPNVRHRRPRPLHRSCAFAAAFRGQNRLRDAGQARRAWRSSMMSR